MKHIISNLMFILLLLLAVSGCNAQNISRTQAKEILFKYYGAKQKEFCSLNHKLTKKPEFKYLVNDIFCKVDIEVTGIQMVSETEVIVEWKTITTANIEALEAWKGGMNGLRSRLRRLYPVDRRVAGFPNNFYWVFKDPTDDEEYLHDITEATNFGNIWSVRPADITKSKQYKFYDKIEQEVDKYIQKKVVESNVDRTTLRLYDDGWRVMEVPKKQTQQIPMFNKLY